MIIRKESQYGSPKEMMYDATVWAEAGLQFDEWLESFRTVNPVMKHVIGDMYLISSVWERNTVRYSGIHMLDGNSDNIPKSGVNFDNYQWGNVIHKSDEINVALYGPQAAKGVKHKSSRK